MLNAISSFASNDESGILCLFGDAVRDRRRALGQSQEAFADLCGIDRSYMGGVERGQRNLGLTNVMKIISALGIQPSEFFKALDAPAARSQKP